MLPPPSRAERGLLALVGAILRDRPAPADLELDLASVRRHLLGPLAWRAGCAAMRGEFVAAAMHAERRAQFLAEAVAALAGIPILRLKGIAYAGTLYPDPALRPMTDIDLMVPADRFAEADRRLRALGYQDDGKRNQRSAANHAVTFRRRESAIDLHRSMVQRGRMPIDLAELWRTAVPGADATSRPAPTEEYLIHLAHMARHEFGVPLIAYIDASRLRARVTDPSAHATRWGLSRAHRLLEAYLEALERSSMLELFVFPGTLELLRGASPPRWLQLARKIAIHDDPRDLLGFTGASIRTRLGL